MNGEDWPTTVIDQTSANGKLYDERSFNYNFVAKQLGPKHNMEIDHDGGSDSLGLGIRTAKWAGKWELAELLSQYEERTDSIGRATVMRNEYLPEREVPTGIGPINVKLPVASRGMRA